jgi:hypothetical protein
MGEGRAKEVGLKILGVFIAIIIGAVIIFFLWLGCEDMREPKVEGWDYPEEGSEYILDDPGW